MAAESCAVAGKDHGFAAQHPLAVALVVAALGQVVHLAIAAGIDQRHVLAVPAARADVGRQQPAAVGTPLIPHVAVAIGVDVLAVHQGAHGLALDVHGPQCGAVFQEGHALAVGAVSGLDAGLAGVGELLLDQVGGIGKQFLVLVLDAGLVDLPHAAALAVIDDAAAVGREVDGAFLLGSVGHLLGSAVVHRGHIHVAMHHKGHFLAAGRYADCGGAAPLDLAHKFPFGLIGSDGDGHALGLTALAQGVDLTIIAIAQRAVAGHGQESHGILGMVGKLHGLAANGALVHVEGAVHFAQVVIGLAVGSPARCAVLAVEGRQLGELAVALEPYVTSDRRGVMLAEGVLIALDVVIQDVAAAVDAQILHRQLREQPRAAAAGAHLIHLRKRAAGKQNGLGRGHIGGLEQHRGVVQETKRRLVAAIGGQATGRAAVLAHDIHVETALARRGKGHLLSIGAPHGIGVVGPIGGQLMGCAALHGNGKQVPLIRESDGLPVGRNGAKAHPQGIVLGCSTDGQQRRCNQAQFSVDTHI